MSQLQEQFKQAKALAAHGEYDQALSVVESLCAITDAWPDLLVLKGDLIQVSQQGEYSLQDAEDAYRQAIDIDPAHIEAYIELSELYATVLEQPQRARDIRQQGRNVLLDAWKRMAETGPDEDRMKAIYYLVLLDRLGPDKVCKARQLLAELLDIRLDDQEQISWPRWHESISREELENAGR
jgi:tetratricopeptide (TPR) repeat protein